MGRSWYPHHHHLVKLLWKFQREFVTGGKLSLLDEDFTSGIKTIEGPSLPMELPTFDPLADKRPDKNFFMTPDQIVGVVALVSHSSSKIS